ncbi:MULTISPECIES: hypothetical protein [Rhodomicrobium]|uniref:hypothetical protein n=1 Tax=Rhodomicrobium TaxID=1068 RepID=UPI000B4BD05E|nr:MULTISPECIES: hypothetical protein [Rhodomicrobium]
MGQFFKTALGVAAVAALSVGFAGLADAGTCKGKRCKDRYGDDEGYRYITAEATFGGKTVTAPVRRGRWGDQVRTPGPGGNWYDCEITCEYTLRRLTVDFWEGIGSNHSVSPGLFRFEYDLDENRLYRKRYQ